jgi:hypothetical protein
MINLIKSDEPGPATTWATLTPRYAAMRSINDHGRSPKG